MPTFKLIVEYDGRGFSGWQKQPGQRTVQGALEEALATVLREPVEVQGASRTDAGVHALGQVANITTSVEIDPNRLIRGASSLCRPDLAVVDAARVDEGFNARFDSHGKHYLYRLLNRSAPSPLRARDSWHVPQRLDLDKMRDCARRLVGTHDFAGFRAADCGRDNTRRTLTAVDVTSQMNGIIAIEVKGTAFLKYMVRILAGTLVDVGSGRLPVGTPSTIFETGDREKAGQTAPAHGLTLV